MGGGGLVGTERGWGVGEGGMMEGDLGKGKIGKWRGRVGKEQGGGGGGGEWGWEELFA